jgi:hypothetical protein
VNFPFFEFTRKFLFAAKKKAIEDDGKMGENSSGKQKRK